MISLDDIYERYGKDIVFLFKGQAPFTEMLGCPGGVLIERDGKVLCYECETWHEKLAGSGGHIEKVHDMTADEYKEKYGFNRNAPLCCRSLSDGFRERALAVIKDNPSLLKKAAKGRARARATIRARGMPPMKGKKRMQHSNGRNSCPEQIKQRYRLLQLKYGNDVSLNTIRKVDSGVEKWAVAHYGSWNNFKVALGEPVDTSSYAKNTAALIYDLREYVQKYARKPWDVYTKEPLNGFKHSETPYKKRFGTVNDAFLAAGITSEYRVIDGYSRKVYEVGYDVDEKFIWESDRSIRRISSSPNAVKMPTYLDKTCTVYGPFPVRAI